MRHARLVVCLACACALLHAAPLEGANEDWPLLLKAFKDTFTIAGLESPGVRSQARAKKRSAVKGLRGSGDARAIPVLLKAHKKQQKFVAQLLAQWAKRHAAWDKIGPGMRRTLSEKQKAAGPGNPISVTPAQKAWIDEPGKLSTLRREISNEEEIAEYIRKGMAKVANSVEGKEREQGVGHLLKAAGRAEKDEQREFVRLLGYVQGDTATNALEAFAADFNPFTAQAGLEALGRQQSPRSIDTLLARLDDPRWQLRVAALKGLSYFHSERVVEALLARLVGEDGVLRRHYFTALGRIIGESLPATVEAWTSFWKANKPDVLKRWEAMPRDGPVKEDLPAVQIKSENNSGSTSFYGLRTESKHIIFVIDVSGSMGEQGGKNEAGKYRIDVAKRELANAVRTLSAAESDERGAASFNIVAYHAEVLVYKSGKMIDATKSNKAKAFKWIEALEANGATNISDALEQAFEIIKTRKAAKQFEKGADTIFLMTDGKPTAGKIMDPVLIREMVKKMNRERQLTIHTIGVGEGHDTQFLQQLAAENNGEYLAR